MGVPDAKTGIILPFIFFLISSLKCPTPVKKKSAILSLGKKNSQKEQHLGSQPHRMSCNISTHLKELKPEFISASFAIISISVIFIALYYLKLYF